MTWERNRKSGGVHSASTKDFKSNSYHSLTRTSHSYRTKQVTTLNKSYHLIIIHAVACQYSTHSFSSTINQFLFLHMCHWWIFQEEKPPNKGISIGLFTSETMLRSFWSPLCVWNTDRWGWRCSIARVQVSVGTNGRSFAGLYRFLKPVRSKWWFVTGRLLEKSVVHKSTSMSKYNYAIFAVTPGDNANVSGSSILATDADSFLTGKYQQFSQFPR